MEKLRMATLIGNILAKLREVEGLSGAEVAERIKKNQSYLSKVERGALGVPGANELKAILENVGATPGMTRFVISVNEYQRSRNEVFNDRYRETDYTELRLDGLYSDGQVYRYVNGAIPWFDKPKEYELTDRGQIFEFGPYLCREKTTVILTHAAVLYAACCPRSLRNLKELLAYFKEAEKQRKIKTFKLVFAERKYEPFSAANYDVIDECLVVFKHFGGYEYVATERIVESLGAFAKYYDDSCPTNEKAARLIKRLMQRYKIGAPKKTLSAELSPEESASLLSEAVRKWKNRPERYF